MIQAGRRAASLGGRRASGRFFSSDSQPPVISTSWFGWGKKEETVQETPLTGGDTTLTIDASGSVPSSADPSSLPADAISAAQSVDLDGISAAFMCTLPASYWPTDLATYAIHSTYELSNSCPYWQAIAATTLAIRTALIPLHVRTMRNSSRMAHMQPEMKQLQDRAADLNLRDFEVQKRHREQMLAVMKKYDCNPIKSLFLPLAQFPIFMGMFFALKELPNKIPEVLAVGGPDVTPYIGQIGDFGNVSVNLLDRLLLCYVFNSSRLLLHSLAQLNVHDPTFILPLATAGTFLLMIELGADGMQTEQSRQLRMGMRALGVLSLGFTSWMPQSVFVYWTINNSFSLVQTLVLKNDKVRDTFGIWKPPKPLPGDENQQSDSIAKVWEKFKKNVQEGRNEGESGGGGGAKGRGKNVYKVDGPELFDRNPATFSKKKGRGGAGKTGKKGNDDGPQNPKP